MSASRETAGQPRRAVWNPQGCPGTAPVEELRLEISNASEALAQRLGRSPTVADLAAHLRVPEDDIIEELDGFHAYRALSLHAPVAGEHTSTDLIDLIGDIDPDLEQVEDREALRPLIAKLPIREQRIIAMRFFGNMAQSQIAAQLGISQMHVSRLLSHALSVLHAGLLTDTDAPPRRPTGGRLTSAAGDPGVPGTTSAMGERVEAERGSRPAVRHRRVHAVRIR